VINDRAELLGRDFGRRGRQPYRSDNSTRKFGRSEALRHRATSSTQMLTVC
jgi:hypothetical protein